MFLSECEKFAKDEHWENKYLAERIIGMTKNLKQTMEKSFVTKFACVEEQTLSQVCVCGYEKQTPCNLLLRAIQNMENFLKNPESFLRSVNISLNLI